MASGGVARNDATSMLRSSASGLMGIARAGATPAKLGASPSGKAADFDSAIRRFESSRPSQAFTACRDFLLFSGKSRELNGLRSLRGSLRPPGSEQKGFLGQFRAPVSDRHLPISGIFAVSELRPVRKGRRLGSHVTEWANAPALAGHGFAKAARRRTPTDPVLGQAKGWWCSEFSADRIAVPGPPTGVARSERAHSR